MRYSLALAALTLVVAGLLSASASAQESSQGESDRAMQLAQEGKLEEAIEIWLNLKEMLLPTDPQLWAIHRNLGRSFQKLKRYPEAWWHLQRSVWLDREQAGKAVEWLASVEKELETQGFLKVKVEVDAPGGTLVFQHGQKERAFSAPLDWWFKPGTQTVKARAPGFKEATKSLVVVAGQSPEAIRLEKVEAPGILVVNVPYSVAKVWIDGALVGQGTVERTLPAGPHTIEVKYGEQVLTDKSVVVQSGRTTVEVVNPVGVNGNGGNGVSSGGSVWPWVTAGSALALGLAGGGLFWMASSNLESARSDFSKDNGLPLPSVTAARADALQSEWDDKVASDVTPYTTTAYVLWGLAGAAAVTSAILFLTDSGPDSQGQQSRWFLAPSIMPDGVGVGFYWTN